VYQRTDDYAAYDFDNFNAAYVRTLDEDLVRRADLILHVGRDLHAHMPMRSEAALLLEQGVDERFLETAPVSTPADLPLHTRPIIGYVGNLEPHKFDAALVRAVASELQECSFVIVGRYHQNAECLRGLKNVCFLGEKPHDAILDYVKSFDVCMLPTAKTTWGLHCKPIKLMEYLAAGRPVVATDTPAADQFREYMHVADTPSDWVAGIRGILNGDHGHRGNPRARMLECSWDRQVDRIWSALHDRGLLSGQLANCESSPSMRTTK
jgi:glycosyltransferase involved in cell wall biosynthesis